MMKKIIYFFKKIFCRKALRRDVIDKMIEEQEEKTSDKSPSDIEKKEEKEKEPTEEKEKEPTEEEIKEANDKVDNILKYVNKTYEENTKIVNAVYECLFCNYLYNNIESIKKDEDNVITINKQRQFIAKNEKYIKCDDKYHVLVYCALDERTIDISQNGKVHYITSYENLIKLKNNSYVDFPYKHEKESINDEIVYFLNDNRRFIGDEILYKKLYNGCNLYRYNREVILCQYKDYGILSIKSSPSIDLLYDHCVIMKSLKNTFPQIDFNSIHCFDTSIVIEFKRKDE